MPYTKTNWTDRQVQRPLTFTQTNNADGSITLAPAEGTVTQAGTPITSTALNNLETQYDQAMADIKVQQAWQSLTLQNGWVYYGGSGGTPAYFKDNMGRVQVKGLIKNGTSTAGTTIATLPAGYRPKETKYLLGDDGSLAQKRIQVNVDGTIVISESVNNQFLILDAVSFFAEQ